uniref:Uncharacterized protein n=1 Tax=Panagrolaimus sp. PS1159 TaxID=55785 RepID=A0AC35EYT2_9BILA
MASEDITVTKFREYIRFDTEQPEPDYEKAYKFLQDYAKELELEVKRYEVIPGRPLIIFGKDVPYTEYVGYTNLTCICLRNALF